MFSCTLKGFLQSCRACGIGCCAGCAFYAIDFFLGVLVNPGKMFDGKVGRQRFSCMACHIGHFCGILSCLGIIDAFVRLVNVFFCRFHLVAPFGHQGIRVGFCERCDFFLILFVALLFEALRSDGQVQLFFTFFLDEGFVFGIVHYEVCGNSGDNSPVFYGHGVRVNGYHGHDRVCGVSFNPEFSVGDSAFGQDKPRIFLGDFLVIHVCFGVFH